jgi:drug/metabolite transporter (DMT)-like permease
MPRPGGRRGHLPRSALARPRPHAPALVDELGAARTSSIAWTVHLGVFPTALGFTTWACALKRTTAGRMGATTYLVPPLTVLMGWALLSETPPARALLGGALCLAGVAVSRRAPRPRAQPVRA